MASMLFRLRQLVIVCVLLVSALFLFNAIRLGTGSEFSSAAHEQFRLSTKDDDDLGGIKLIVTHSDSNVQSKGNKSNKSDDGKDLLQNSKCNIPHLEINGSQVIGFFHKHEPLKCQIAGNGIEPNWVYIDDDGKIRFTENRKKAVCKLRYFRRLNDQKNEYDAPILIKDGDEMTASDYAGVKCIQGFDIWKSLLWTVSKNEKVYKKIIDQKAKEKKNEDSESGTSEKMNVYFLGFDSLSQMSFRRKLPKTVKFLEEVLETVVLNGYNIVGDGTPQAFIPILTAQTEVELPLTRKRYKNANYVDDVYPFIWKNFSDSGYVTAYGEDAFYIGTFTYRLKGFRNQPTDHYTRTLFEQIEKLDDRNCIGSIPLHKMWFDYARQFMKVYSDVPRFLLMHQSLLSHDDVNLVDVEDDDVEGHLRKMHSEGLFDNALVIVMADHGHRFAKLRETHQGQLEERLPFFSFALPKQFRQTERGQLMYKNLLENKERLSTPFDIHATLLDILHPPSIDVFSKLQDATSSRSLSLFRPLPDNRTCTQAGIDAHWCTCLAWQSAMSSEEDVAISRRLAHAVVRAINNETQPERELCAPLRLDRLIDAKKLTPNQGLLAYKNVKDADGFVADLTGNTKAAFAHYQLKLSTVPGNAIYEVTLFYDFLLNEVRFDLSALSHVNKFGDAPHCIIDKNYFLATFCICYDKIPK